MAYALQPPQRWQKHADLVIICTNIAVVLAAEGWINIISPISSRTSSGEMACHTVAISPHLPPTTKKKRNKPAGRGDSLSQATAEEHHLLRHYHHNRTRRWRRKTPSAPPLPMTSPWVTAGIDKQWGKGRGGRRLISLPSLHHKTHLHNPIRQLAGAAVVG